MRIEVGIYKSGEKRFEVRHLNDLKLAHPDSLAAPAHRSKLGRPSKQTEAKPAAEGQQTEPGSSSGIPNRLSEFPHPPSVPLVAQSKQADQIGNRFSENHETSNQQRPSLPSTANEEFEGVITGPPPAPAFRRPPRSTRNQNPCYVDSLSFGSFYNQAL